MTGMAGYARTPREEGAFDRLVAEDGIAHHGFLAHLASTAASNAMLADAAHFLSLLHGRYPGVLDHAADRLIDLEARDWMYRATTAFAAERAYLTRLVVAVGPVPSTAGQAQSEAAVTGQCNALATLSQSERRGCALGAALALGADWWSVRTILDRAAHRAGLKAPPCDLPTVSDTLALAATLTPRLERALLFGARQLASQHHGLFDLLETRAAARASLGD